MRATRRPGTPARRVANGALSRVRRRLIRRFLMSRTRSVPLDRGYRINGVRVPGQGAIPTAGRPRASAIFERRHHRGDRAWVDLYGSPPLGYDWEPYRARRKGNAERLRRFESADWPTNRQVRLALGRFNSAIVAAGYRPRAAPSRVTGRFKSRDHVLAAIQDWAARYGEPPVQADWDPYRARRTGQAWESPAINKATGRVPAASVPTSAGSQRRCGRRGWSPVRRVIGRRHKHPVAGD